MFCVSHAKGGDQCVRYVSLVVLVTNDQPMKMFLIRECSDLPVSDYMSDMSDQMSHVI